MNWIDTNYHVSGQNYATNMMTLQPPNLEHIFFEQDRSHDAALKLGMTMFLYFMILILSKNDIC